MLSSPPRLNSWCWISTSSARTSSGIGSQSSTPEVRVQLVHVAHRVHTQAVLADALVVAQAGGAVVAGAGGDLRKSVAHGVSPSC
jgi:hypothetical protein